MHNYYANTMKIDKYIRCGIQTHVHYSLVKNKPHLN